MNKNLMEGFPIQEKIIEFLFDGKKYRGLKFLFLALFWVVVFFLAYVFQIPLINVYVPILILLLVMGIIKIVWYNKKKSIKGSFGDWFLLVLCIVILGVVSYQYLQEKQLENTVRDVIEEKVDKPFTIDSVFEVNYGEPEVIVRYSIKGEEAEKWDRYYWKDGELVQDVTR
ncbi:hypothetical protein [Oceanobacillus kapialis]|uniref:DUF4178 domain-containing protein n=1 Tax=Oceanobacillus kapialis TaxID=481353 RepID=A0ABW5Q2Y4_9BACI